MRDGNLAIPAFFILIAQNISMVNRDLYIASYDIGEPARLVQVLKIVRAYATGGQKSVYECFLTPVEKRDLLAGVQQIIHLPEDRFFLLRLDPRATVETLGIGSAPEDPDFFYHG